MSHDAHAIGRYEAYFNGFQSPGFNTTQDYTTFANVTMRQRMGTYIAKSLQTGGLLPLIGEWSLFFGACGERPALDWHTCTPAIFCLMLGGGPSPDLSPCFTSAMYWPRTSVPNIRCSVNCCWYTCACQRRD